MGDQSSQRFDLAKQASGLCTTLIQTLHALNDLAERRALLGNFVVGDFAGTELAYLGDGGALGVLCDTVAPRLMTAYIDAGNGNQVRQIMQQVAAKAA